MKAIFAGDLTRWLYERFGPRLRPVYHRLIHTTGIPESALAERVEKLLPEDLGPVSLAYLPDLTGVDLTQLLSRLAQRSGDRTGAPDNGRAVSAEAAE